MDLPQLASFQVVARLEHMTRAAAALGVAQPFLSRTIAQLEQEIGVPLFDRRGRRIRLNRFGRAFLGHVNRALAELADGRREVADLAGLEHGQVVLAATTLRSVPDLLTAFRARHPDVRFRLVQADAATMRRQLERGECDLCLSSPPLEGPGIDSVPVLTEEIFLAVPATHRLAHRGSIGLGEVAAEPFITLKPGDGMRALTDEFCRQAGFSPHVVCEVDEPGAIRALVRAGLGVAFLPAVSWRLAEEETVPLRIATPTCRRILGLAWRDDRYLSAATRHFRRFAIDYFASLP